MAIGHAKMKIDTIKINLQIFTLSIFFILQSTSVFSAEIFYKPFILAQYVKSTDTRKIAQLVRKRMINNGFQVVGSYSPFPGTEIIVISNDKLRHYSSLSENGIYATIQRISITAINDQIQISYTNPTYMAHAYRLKNDLSDISSQLKKALGFTVSFGAEQGLTKEMLRNYRYKWIMMPQFTDRLELAEYPTQKEAIKAVLNALEKNEAGVRKIYRVDLENKNETIIGVSMKGNGSNECSSDQYIMQKIDFKKLKSTGHLPYEIIIKNGSVNALFAEFRIAMNFPDLSMMGDNSFASIMCAPESILEALTLAAGGDPEDSW